MGKNRRPEVSRPVMPPRANPVEVVDDTPIMVEEPVVEKEEPAPIIRLKRYFVASRDATGSAATFAAVKNNAAEAGLCFISEVITPLGRLVMTFEREGDSQLPDEEIELRLSVL
jgi:hypothetical protein